MPFTNESIVVEGLRDFASEIRQLDENKLLGQAHKALSSYVADEAKDRASALSGRFPSYKEVKLGASANSREVIVNVKKPLGHAAEWGTKVQVVFGRRYPASVLRKRVWPEWGTEGYLVHPVLRDKQEEIIQRYSEALQEVAARVFPDGA